MYFFLLESRKPPRQRRAPVKTQIIKLYAVIEKEVDVAELSSGYVIFRIFRVFRIF